MVVFDYFEDVLEGFEYLIALGSIVDLVDFSNCKIDPIRMSSSSKINFVECGIPCEPKLKEYQIINFKNCLIDKYYLSTVKKWKRMTKAIMRISVVI